MSEVLNPSKKRSRSSKFDNLVGPTDPKVDHLARERLVTARIGLLLRHSFFGNLATRMQLVNADEWCSTGASTWASPSVAEGGAASLAQPARASRAEGRDRARRTRRFRFMCSSRVRSGGGAGAQRPPPAQAQRRPSAGDRAGRAKRAGRPAG